MKNTFWILLICGLCLLSSVASSSTISDVEKILPIELKEKILKIHKQEFIKHLDLTHPKICVLFSGTQGMGKTFISRKIEDHFKGIRISTNVVRSLFLDYGVPVTPETVHYYLIFALNRILNESRNHMIIFDTSMDRSWGQVTGVKESIEKIFPESRQFWIRLQVDFQQVMNNLRERNDYVQLKDYMETRYFPSWEQFGLTRGFDFRLTGNVPFVDQTGLMINKLNEKLNAIQLQDARVK